MAPTKPALTSAPEINVFKTKGGRTLFKKPTKKYSTVAGRRPIRKFARGKLFRRYQFDTINSAYSTRAEAIAKETKTKSSALMPVLTKAKEPEAGKEKSENIEFVPESDFKVDLSK